LISKTNVEYDISKLAGWKFSNGLLNKNGKKDPKIHMKLQKTPNGQSTLGQGEQSWSITLPDMDKETI
jgi:hypothetical protein